METQLEIKYDHTAGAWTDGTNYVSGTVIRRYAIYRLGRKDPRGRLSKEEIARYFKDAYGVIADVR